MTTELAINRVVEGVMVFGSGCVLVGGMAAVDYTVYARVTSVLQGNGLTELSTVGSNVQRVLFSYADTIGYHGMNHGMLSMFAVAAVVLFVFMFRV